MSTHGELMHSNQWLEHVDRKTKHIALQTLHFINSKTCRAVDRLRSMRPMPGMECVLLPVNKIAMLLRVSKTRCTAAAFAARIGGVVDDQGVLRVRVDAKRLRRLAVFRRV